ncbi:hypothetical protein AB0F91_38585 [Amycolatopsis sp. NPDC023774]|uniref:hypothetical protein n=1 Tax=Amycolatopsis sp. NPDC023774 TaxID=3155015 RepID=UPI0033E8125B
MTNPLSRDEATIPFIRALVSADDTERAFDWAARFRSNLSSVFDLCNDLNRFRSSRTGSWQQATVTALAELPSERKR